MEVVRGLNLSFRPMDLRHDRFEQHGFLIDDDASCEKACCCYCVRPVKVHRSRVMKKLGIVAVADLVRLVETAQIAFPGWGETKV